LDKLPVRSGFTVMRRNVLKRLEILEKEMLPIVGEVITLNVTFISPITKDDCGKGFQVVVPLGPRLPPRASRKFRNRGRA